MKNTRFKNEFLDFVFEYFWYRQFNLAVFANYKKVIFVF